MNMHLLNAEVGSGDVTGNKYCVSLETSVGR